MTDKITVAIRKIMRKEKLKSNISFYYFYKYLVADCISKDSELRCK